MRRSIVALGSFMAAAIVMGGSANARSKSTSCNVRERVAALEKDTGNFFGPGLYIRGAKRNLSDFKKNITELITKEGILPKNATEAAQLRTKLDIYADVTQDLEDFSELLKDVVSAHDDLCRKCVLKPVWDLFASLQMPLVSASFMEEIRTKKNFPLLKETAALYIKEAAMSRDDPNAVTTIRDGAQERILLILGGIQTVKEGVVPWQVRYSGMERDRANREFATELQRLTAAQCPQ